MRRTDFLTTIGRSTTYFVSFKLSRLTSAPLEVFHFNDQRASICAVFSRRYSYRNIGKLNFEILPFGIIETPLTCRASGRRPYRAMPTLCRNGHTVQVVSEAELNKTNRSLEEGCMLPFSSKDAAERSAD